MPRRRPIDFLKRLGRRIKARRKIVGRTRAMLAGQVEVSTQQIQMYETGIGHPPAATLHRIALALGTSSSALLGEDVRDGAQDIDTITALYADPATGAVMRYMAEMTVENRKSLQVIAASLKNRSQPPDKVEVMT